jgi:hypothetical protein
MDGRSVEYISVRETISIEIYSRQPDKTPYGVSHDESSAEISLIFSASILWI